MKAHTTRLLVALSLLQLTGCSSSQSGNDNGTVEGNVEGNVAGNDGGSNDQTDVAASLDFESRVLNEAGEQWEFYYAWTEEFRGMTYDQSCSGPFRIYLEADDTGDLFVVITEREYCQTPRQLGDRRYAVDADGNIGDHNLAATTDNGGYLTEDELFIRTTSSGGCIYEFHFQIDENDMGSMSDSKSSDCTAMDAFETEIRPYEAG